ncbi:MULTISPECIES: cell wall metabolism sensor histidine kinase WalK [Pseudomonas]|uniref:sensor histidine kinase n=1 Tax=Pseudomonas TaxID=286 RepID=UPI000EFCE629|nr:MULTISPECIES: ATP-binding protein [Pseudomonas]AYN93338.1 HAMP domain-containing protein [Pseudomonas sp. LTJR-52]MBA1248705.1 HAMP domain-containing protein [Pseudomonas zeshuii]QEU27757.1 HAMP domain-containing protein [Pseudomonas luteola]
MRRLDTLFARLFGVLVIAIVLGHLLAFAWFHYMGRQPGPSLLPPSAESRLPPPAITAFSGPHPPPPFAAKPSLPPPAGPPGSVLSQLGWILGGPFPFQLGTLLVAAWISARLLTRPISRLTAAAQDLSDNLDSPPIPETGPHETREAARVMNQMRERIVAQIQQRGRMLAAVSHDLRTPLARVKLRLEDIDDPQLRSRVTQDVDDMINLLNATLEYLREQRSEEPWVLFDIQALAESLTENALDDGADVSLSGQCKPVRAQAMALRSCLTNLLDNALRYGGSAEIVLKEHPDSIEIQVRDHGPGISAQYREAVFEPFFRLEGSRNRNSGGVGLGLAIARESIQNQGGTLRLEETPGGGLTALIMLPIRSA